MKEALRSTIENQIVLETNKLQKLEQQTHQWVQQEISSLDKLDIIYLQMKRLLETAKEKHQFHGKDSIPFHSRKYVDIIKFDYNNHRHPENTTKLDGIPTSAGSDS